jgi:hypothetical protein
MSEPFDDEPYRHPLSRRVMAAVLVAVLVLGVVGIGVAIAQAQWGPPTAPVSEQPAVNAAG